MDRNAAAKRLHQLLTIDTEDRTAAVGGEVVGRTTRGDAAVEILSLDLNGREPVAAVFLSPREASPRGPVVLYNHAHGGNYRRGKDELLDGAEFLQEEPYAAALVRQGYRVLCYDAWCFGERRARTELATFKHLLWNGEVLWGRMVYDALRAVDYLAGRPDVDPGRIGTLGMSMGGTLAWWLAALEPRVRTCVDLCGLADAHTLDRLGGHDGHGVYYYVPGLLGEFTTGQIAGLSAPRWHLSLVGRRDSLTPAEGFDPVDQAVRSAYAASGHVERWMLSVHPGGHFETAAMRAQALAFLRETL